jgi:alanine racemase
MQSKTWVNINTEALKNNFNNLAVLVDSARIESDADAGSGGVSEVDVRTGVKKMSVVKSNAYGHGMIECAQVLANAGTDFLAVDAIEEALEIREAGIETPILVLGWTPTYSYNEAAIKNISITISTRYFLEKTAEILNTENKLKIHIKADTGLHRQGFQLGEIDGVLESVQSNDNIEVEGLYTHLAGAEDPSLKSYTDKQISEYNEWISAFEDAGLKTIRHAGASAIALNDPEIFFDMVRFGISLYGLWPSPEIQNLAGDKITLEPVLKWESKITEIKEISAGEPVGYDCTEKVSVDSRIAVVPIGYWHGFPRAGSRENFVSVGGQKAKVLGNVSMDMIVIDVTGIICNVEDSVEIIGDNISAEEMAKNCDTINYEIVTRINQDIPRIFS